MKKCFYFLFSFLIFFSCQTMPSNNTYPGIDLSKCPNRRVNIVDGHCICTADLKPAFCLRAIYRDMNITDQVEFSGDYTSVLEAEYPLNGYYCLASNSFRDTHNINATYMGVTKKQKVLTKYEEDCGPNCPPCHPIRQEITFAFD